MTQETKNEKKYRLAVPRISRKTFSSTFGQFTNPDNKENLQNNSHIQIKKKNYNKSIIKCH